MNSSKHQSKNWRKKQSWYKGGKSNECENFQINLLNERFNSNINRNTNLRINLENYELEINKTPLNEINGFDYTEDFDGLWEKDNKKLYINLKMICEPGGSQTRSIREVNHFIKAQHEYLLKHKNSNEYFVNIIDGDQGYKFIYDNYNNYKASLLDIKRKEKYNEITDKIYIGDMNQFENWYLSTI